MSLSYITVTGSFAGPSGTALSGLVSFTPSAPLTDSTTNQVFPAGPATFWLNMAGGLKTDPLLCTDNSEITPSGWTYQVAVTTGGQAPQIFSVLLPSSLGSTVDIADLVPVTLQPGTSAYVPVTGGAMTGLLLLSGDPVAALGAATKEYVDGRGSGDKTFTQPFTAASVVTVPHGLSKYPAVTVTDTAGDQVDGDVLYLSTASLIVSFSAPFSGTVICN